MIEDNPAGLGKVESMLEEQKLADKESLQAARFAADTRGNDCDMVSPASDLHDRYAMAGLDLIKLGGIPVNDNIEHYQPKDPNSRLRAAHAWVVGCETSVRKSGLAEMANWRCIQLTENALLQKRLSPVVGA
jgi:hypothetical protein